MLTTAKLQYTSKVKSNLLRLVEFVGDESNNYGNDEDDREAELLAHGRNSEKYVAPEPCC
jgi:hypothetical protein